MDVQRERPRDLTSNALKIIAIILMFFDHFFAVFYPAYGFLRIPGRVVMPIFCYLIAEGFHYTSNLRKYLFRLFLFAIITHFIYVLCFDLTWWRETSALWGLTLGLAALAAAKNEKLSVWLRVVLVAVCCVLAYPADWKVTPVLWIVFFGLYRGDFKKQIISFIIIGTALTIVPAILREGFMHTYQFGIFLAIPLLALYRGRRGRKSLVLKWGFYVFYPLHLLIIYIVRLALGV